jgi:hypothetical protein
MLAAENSTVVAQKNHHSRRVRPQGAQADGLSVSVRQSNVRESAAIGGCHGQVIVECREGTVKLNGDSFCLQCARLAQFLRLTFMSWYSSPCYLAEIVLLEEEQTRSLPNNNDNEEESGDGSSMQSANGAAAAECDLRTQP